MSRTANQEPLTKNRPKSRPKSRLRTAKLRTAKPRTAPRTMKITKSTRVQVPKITVEVSCMLDFTTSIPATRMNENDIWDMDSIVLRRAQEEGNPHKRAKKAEMETALQRAEDVYIAALNAFNNYDDNSEVEHLLLRFNYLNTQKVFDDACKAWHDYEM